jgi:hypothetical protein
MQAALALDCAFGELDAAISVISDEPERRIFARSLGNLIGQVNDTFIRTIARQYPELDPNK